QLTFEGVDDDSFFNGWSGACSGTGPTCDVTVSGKVVVGAAFKRRSFEPTASGVTGALRAIFGLPPPATGAVFAGGDGGKVVRWNGTSWAMVATSKTFPINGLWASSASSVFAVGAGAPLRWDGSTWNAAAGVYLDPFYGVFGTSASDVWAVSQGGGG